AHAPGGALRAFAAAVRGLAAHDAADERAAHAPAHLTDDAGVLVAEHQRRLPGEEALRGVNVGATDTGGVDGHHDLARAGDGLRHLVDREAVLTPPGRGLHHTSSLRFARLVWRKLPQ